MKDHQFFSDIPAPPTQQGAEPNDDILKQRNSSLQGRVQVLQEQNRRLEGCIAQLKLIAETVNYGRIELVQEFCLSHIIFTYLLGPAGLARLKMSGSKEFHISMTGLLWLALLK